MHERGVSPEAELDRLKDEFKAIREDANRYQEVLLRSAT
jgi:hypothetical protein